MIIYSVIVFINLVTLIIWINKMLKTNTPAPPKYKKKLNKYKIGSIIFLLLLLGFLVLNHFASLLVICTPFYSSPYLCEEIGNTRIITFATDLIQK